MCLYLPAVVCRKRKYSSDSSEEDSKKKKKRKHKKRYVQHIRYKITRDCAFASLKTQIIVVWSCGTLLSKINIYNKVSQLHTTKVCVLRLHVCMCY